MNIVYQYHIKPHYSGTYPMEHLIHIYNEANINVTRPDPEILLSAGSKNFQLHQLSLAMISSDDRTALVYSVWEPQRHNKNSARDLR